MIMLKNSLQLFFDKLYYVQCVRKKEIENGKQRNPHNSWDVIDVCLCVLRKVIKFINQVV